MSLLGAHGAVMSGSAAPPLARWNPADKASQVTLSARNRVCTRSSENNNSWRAVRSVTSHASGKWYAECVNDVNGSVNGSMCFGIATSAASVNAKPGSSTTGWATQPNNSPRPLTLHDNSTTVRGTSPLGAGGYAKVAVDIDNGLVWLGDSVNDWYTGDPAAGTSPTYSFTPGTELFLILGQYSVPQQNTLCNHDGEAAGAVPSGFEMWG